MEGIKGRRKKRGRREGEQGGEGREGKNEGPVEEWKRSEAGSWGGLRRERVSVREGEGRTWKKRRRKAGGRDKPSVLQYCLNDRRNNLGRSPPHPHRLYI